MTAPSRGPARVGSRRRELRRRVPPFETWPKRALYARARKLAIEGRSTMRKRDLVYALTNW